MVDLGKIFSQKGLGEQVKDYVEKNHKGDQKFKVRRPFYVKEANKLLM